MATVLEDPRLLACSKLIENTSFYSEKKDMTTVLKSEKVSCGLFFQQIPLPLLYLAFHF